MNIVVTALALFSFFSLFGMESTQIHLFPEAPSADILEHIASNIDKPEDYGKFLRLSKQSYAIGKHLLNYPSILKKFQIIRKYESPKMDPWIEIEPLHFTAIRLKALGAFKAFVCQNKNILNETYRCKFPLHYMMEHNAPRDFVEVWVKNGYPIQKKDNYNNNALHYARSEEIAKFLIENSVSVNEENNGKQTPLHRAQSVEIAHLLISHGADVNKQDRNGKSALYFAVETKNIPLTMALISFGADVNQREHENDPTTMNSRASILHGIKSKKIAQLLLNCGAKINMRNDSGQVSLHRAASGKIAQLLINHGAKVNEPCGLNQTPLYTVRSAEIAQVLINNGANVNYRGSHGMTPLHHMFEFENASCEIANVLLDNKGLVNAVDDHGNTPLHLAAQNREIKPAAIELLLNYGANKTVKNHYSRTPFDLIPPITVNYKEKAIEQHKKIVSLLEIKQENSKGKKRRKLS